MLGLLLRQQAARSAGTLLAWLQQRPEQLRFDVLQQVMESAAHGGSYATANMWMLSCECLVTMKKELSAAFIAAQPGCNAAALAAATLQQLEQSGLLSSMHASLVPLMQVIRQQWSSTSLPATPYYALFDIVRCLMSVVNNSLHYARVLVPAALQHTAVQATRQLLQQLQACGVLLPDAATATSSSGSNSSNSNSSSSSSSPYVAYVHVQLTAAANAFVVESCLQQQQLPADVALQVQLLLADQAVQEVMLQPLAACVALLHHQQQRQRQQQSTGGLIRMLYIPAYYEDMLLPGGQS
uniref:Uncharacterized protein n=1 Tax=Tetradesmus obliquus TaxID=3088 RepID=A0A383V9Z3_TETOB|eukprot:jgi/Sobl393_1/10033/SZX76454.1